MPKIRIRNGFSDRNKFNKIPTVLQIDDFSADTRTVIKNEVLSVLNEWREGHRNRGVFGFDEWLAEKFFKEVFNLPINSLNCNIATVIDLLCESFDSSPFHEVLTLAEYLAGVIIVFDYVPENPWSCQTRKVQRDLRKVFNQLFEQEHIGYRFLDEIIVPITNQEELSSIQQSFQTAFDEKVNDHIKKAIMHLSTTGDRDYKNSVKESVMAVEGLFHVTKETDSNRFADLLNSLAKKNNIHPSLKEAINKLYGYASDEAGIRHENSRKEKEVDLHEAKFVLVTCSAIINYLISLPEPSKAIND